MWVWFLPSVNYYTLERWAEDKVHSIAKTRVKFFWKPLFETAKINWSSSQQLFTFLKAAINFFYLDLLGPGWCIEIIQHFGFSKAVIIVCAGRFVCILGRIECLFLKKDEDLREGDEWTMNVRQDIVLNNPLKFGDRQMQNLILSSVSPLVLNWCEIKTLPQLNIFLLSRQVLTGSN